MYNDNIVFLDREETIELIIDYKQSANKEVLNRLLQSNLPLIKSIVKKEATRLEKMDKYDDYFQEAVIQFIRCINNYELNDNSGASFQTYLHASIPGSLMRYTHYMEKGPLNLKKEIYRKFLRAEKFEKQYIEKHNKKPTIEEKAKYAGTTVKVLKKYEKSFSIFANMRSLNEVAMVQDNGLLLEVQDLLVDDSNLNETVENRMLIEQCFNLIENKKHRQMLYMHIVEQMTQNQIAKIMNTSQTGVNRVIRRSLNKIRLEMGSELVEYRQ